MAQTVPVRLILTSTSEISVNLPFATATATGHGSGSSRETGVPLYSPELLQDGLEAHLPSSTLCLLSYLGAVVGR